MAEPLVRAKVEPFCDVRMGRELTHDDEKGYDRIAVSREVIEEVFDDEIAGRRERHKEDEAEKADEYHAIGHLEPGEKKGQGAL